MTIDYGTIVKTRRQEMGLSQIEVADRAVCDLSVVGRIERGEGVHLDTFLSVLAALDLRVDVVEVRT